MSSLVAFDSNVLTAFLYANSGVGPGAGEALEAFRLFLYSPSVIILPTITIEAEKILLADKRREHLNWIWNHFPEAQLRDQSPAIERRTEELIPAHPQKDPDDCRIIAEAEAAGADILATFDRKIKRLQARTVVQLLTPAMSLQVLGVESRAEPHRQPAGGHPHAGVDWWRL